MRFHSESTASSCANYLYVYKLKLRRHIPHILIYLKICGDVNRVALLIRLGKPSKPEAYRRKSPSALYEFHHKMLAVPRFPQRADTRPQNRKNGLFITLAEGLQKKLLTAEHLP